MASNVILTLFPALGYIVLAEFPNKCNICMQYNYDDLSAQRHWSMHVTKIVPFSSIKYKGYFWVPMALEFVLTGPIPFSRPNLIRDRGRLRPAKWHLPRSPTVTDTFRRSPVTSVDISDKNSQSACAFNRRNPQSIAKQWYTLRFRNRWPTKVSWRPSSRVNSSTALYYSTHILAKWV